MEYLFYICIKKRGRKEREAGILQNLL